jgi:tetratricopeptide (TPR) repeat protein
MESAPNHYNLGLELAASGKIREAMVEFRTASRLDTADADALSEIGRLEIGEKRLRDAAASLDEALSRNPRHAGALNNRAVVDFLESRYSEAAERFRAAVLADPSLADAWYNLADTCELLGDIDGKKEAQLRFQELSDDN